MINIDSHSIERYSHCLCLHVQPTSLIIGFIHLISSLLNIVLHFENYTQYHEEERRMIDLHKSTTTSLNMMVSLMMAIVSALLIYGVTKSRPSYLMPFFGIKLYIFFFSLPASISMLCFSPHATQFDSNGRTWGGEMKRLWSSFDPSTAYTSNIFMALIEFLYQLYFICVIWKCYRYLKLKEAIIPLHLPYHLRGVEITAPSETVTTPSTLAPPDYETATKLNPPPDYESALKNYQTPVPNLVNNTSANQPIATEPAAVNNIVHNVTPQECHNLHNNHRHLQTVDCPDVHNVPDPSARLTFESQGHGDELSNNPVKREDVNNTNSTVEPTTTDPTDNNSPVDASSIDHKNRSK